jgi:hypothetical protein
MASGAVSRQQTLPSLSVARGDAKGENQMKSLLLASAIAMGLLGVSSAAYADACNSGGKRTCISAFGDPFEAKVGDKMMHMQLVEDSTGAQWVVVPRDEAEAMMGMKMGDHKFTKVPM